MKIITDEASRLAAIAKASMDTDSRVGSRKGACKGLIQSRAQVPPAGNCVQNALDTTACQIGLVGAVARDVKKSPALGAQTLLRIITH